MRRSVRFSFPELYSSYLAECHGFEVAGWQHAPTIYMLPQ